jgi:surface polysaccharide O-acyltransferase-like enzyme
MLSEKISRIINLYRFPLTIAVVLIHTPYSQVYFKNGSIGFDSKNLLPVFVYNLISWSISGVAVPLFFVFSGFLFFQNYTYSWDNYKIKLRLRIKSLFVPYMFWNIMLIGLLILGESSGLLKNFISGRHKLISNYNLLDFLNGLFAITTVNPEAYHFWFIRDLIILVVISPFIWFIAKRWPLKGLILFLTMWIFGVRFFFSGAASPLFFYIGCLLTSTNFSDVCGFDLDRRYFKYSQAAAFLFFLTAIVAATLKTFQFYFIAETIHYITILSGIIGAWYIGMKRLDTEFEKIMMILTPFSFFCFASHEPLLTVLSKILYRLLHPTSSFEIISLYIFLPFLTVILTLSFGLFFMKTMPKFYYIITGSRNYRVSIGVSI